MVKIMQQYKTLITLTLSTILLLSLLLSGCIENGDEEGSDYFFYSFETDLNGWKPDGTDLSDPPINWSIDLSDDFASEGNKSVKIYLNNLNDAGKIWMEKEFFLEAKTEYEIEVSYQFATSDFGSFNLFRIITGVTTKNPEDVDDLIFQDDTGNHQDQDVGYIWLNKSYSFNIKTDENGEIYVSIGVWGTWETPRTYYVDTVAVNISKTTTENIPNLSGKWHLSYYDQNGIITKQENVTIIQNNTSVHIKNETKTLCTGTLLKNSDDISDLVPQEVNYLISDCDFGGLGIQYIYVYNESYMKTDLPLCENCSPAIFLKNDEGKKI